MEATPALLCYLIACVLFVSVDALPSKCKDGDFMRDPASCDHFYKCDHGAPVKFACGPGTWFNPVYNVCDWPYNVKCEVNPGGQSTGSSGGQQGSRSGYNGSKPGSGSNNNQGYPGSVYYQGNPGNENGYNQNKPGGSSNYGGSNGGQNSKPSNSNQGQPNRPDQGGSYQDANNEEYLWPIQNTDAGSTSGNNNNNNNNNNNGGPPGQTEEDRPRPTIDDLYTNGNNHLYRPYLTNRWF